MSGDIYHNWKEGDTGIYGEEARDTTNFSTQSNYPTTIILPTTNNYPVSNNNTAEVEKFGLEEVK